MNLDAGKHQAIAAFEKIALLGGFLVGSVEDVAPIFLLVGGCLDVDGVETMATFGKKIKPNHITFEETIHKRYEVGTAGHVAGEGANSQIDLCGKDGEKSVVECNVRVEVHRPELGRHVKDIIGRQVYESVSTGYGRVETRDWKRTVSAQDENCALVGQCDALIERKSADIGGEERVGCDLL